MAPDGDDRNVANAIARRETPGGIKDVLCQPLGSFGCQEVPGGARM
jgi:hypothetical protein